MVDTMMNAVIREHGERAFLNTVALSLMKCDCKEAADVIVDYLEREDDA